VTLEPRTDGVSLTRYSLTCDRSGTTSFMPYHLCPRCLTTSYMAASHVQAPECPQCGRPEPQVLQPLALLDPGGEDPRGNSSHDDPGLHKHGLSGVAQPHDPLATRPRGIRRGRALAPGARDLARIIYRDPEHVPERITLKTIERLAESALAWAQAIRAERPEVEPAVMAEELRHQSATVARIDGAIAGTPFFVAIVPGYLGYLWQEAMMVLRTAALYDRDPRQLTTAAESLSLRGVHPSPEAALAALEAVLAKPLPDKPPCRRTLRNWVQSIRMVLVFGGFLSPPKKRSPIGRRAKLLTVAGLLFATIVFVITWVFPVTFIIAMAWGCESHTRGLGRRVAAFYGGEATTTRRAITASRSERDAGHRKRRTIHTLSLFLSIAIPIAFVAFVVHVRSTTVANGLGAAGALVALSLVTATTVVATHR
jgi:hypothetical protein